MSMNPFEQMAEQQQNAWSKARDRANDRRLAKLVVESERDAPMVASPSDKAMFERSQAMRAYNRWQADQRAELLAGPHSERVRELLTLLDSLVTPEPLLAALEHWKWFVECDRDTRLQILKLISNGIARHRVRQGLAPFDDSLPGEPPTAYETIRSNMQVLS